MLFCPTNNKVSSFLLILSNLVVSISVLCSFAAFTPVFCSIAILPHQFSIFYLCVPKWLHPFWHVGSGVCYHGILFQFDFIGVFVLVQLHKLVYKCIKSVCNLWPVGCQYLIFKMVLCQYKFGLYMPFCPCNSVSCIGLIL